MLGFEVYRQESMLHSESLKHNNHFILRHDMIRLISKELEDGASQQGVILSELCHLVYCLEDQDKKSVAHGDQYVMILGRPDYSTIKKAAQQRWMKQLVCETSWPVWEP
nr:hypothetical protein CFP56_34011 [Quercus suber]